ncbi:MAG: fimbrial biosis outer rane usher protein [Massilia sp.]|nr:fimbrial biosis outer rane usher protein [Massilia sp.]
MCALPPACEDSPPGRAQSLHAPLEVLAVLWLGTSSLLWATPALATQLAVSLLQPVGAAVQLRVRISAGVEPVLNWTGTTMPTPYRLDLTWNDSNVTLERPLPALPSEGMGALQTIVLRSAPEQSRLELQLSEAVQPRLLRVGDSWVLRLEPVAKADPASAPLPLAVPSRVNAPLPLARGPAQAGSKGNGNRKLPGPEFLLVDVTINGQRLQDVVRTEQLTGGPLLLPAAAWREARLLPLAHAAVLSDGTPGYAVDAVPGATYRINRQSLSLEINAPAAAFLGSALELQNRVAAPPPRPQPGVMLNYDVSLSQSSGSSYSGATLEAVAFSGFGNIVTSALISHTGSGNSAARLATFWRYDLPHRMETLIVGDTVGVGGGWSRPVRYGGIRWGRDFGMRPGFVTLPQISIAGEAALPSTVEVLVNNARRLSQPVQPGPFDLSNVPIVTGAGEISLVVRDLLGRETVVLQSYYASPLLLAPGLTDFSFEAGRLRTGFGRDNVYGDGFGAATWRQGLTNSLTGELRLELQRERRAAGLELSGLLGTWGVAHVALAASSGDTQGPHESGTLAHVGIERSTPRGGAALQYEHASRSFAPFGEAFNPPAVRQRARDRWLFSMGGSLWGALSGGASYVRQTRWDADQVQLLGLSLSVPLWHRASMSVSVNKRLDGDHGLIGTASINLPLDNGIQTTGRVERGTDGQVSGAVAAIRNPPAGPGLGWRVQAASTESQRAQAGLQYNTSHAEWALDAVTDAHGQVATREGGRGTVGWFNGMAFASRPVGEGSVAVIKVDGIAGVPVMRGNQVVAATDARGLAFLPGLMPWQKNLIAIDPVDLPLDVEMAGTSKEVTPYARSGMVVDFALKRSRQALLVLRQSGGVAVPVGTKVRLLPAGPEFIAGLRGEVWLTDLAETQQRVHVSWRGGSCTLEFAVPASPGGAPGKIGPVACEEAKP